MTQKQSEGGGSGDGDARRDAPRKRTAANQESDRCGGRLNDEQRLLVRENLGLVGVHLRRHRRRFGGWRRGREWEDLFQEGCLGLMQAALRYDSGCGIRFAAYALPRIHNAISRALRPAPTSTFVTPADGDPPESSGGSASRAAYEPVWVSLSDPNVRRFLADESSAVNAPDVETIGDRLRRKYQRALRLAARRLATGSTARSDREQLIRTLCVERLLILQEETRRPLRRIADDTRSSFARVAECERQLCQHLRDVLTADVEFAELRRQARRDPNGLAAGIDEGLERSLAGAGAFALAFRYRHADPVERARLFHAAFHETSGDPGNMLRDHFVRLPARARQRVFERLEELDRPRGRRTKEARESPDGRRSARPRRTRARVAHEAQVRHNPSDRLGPDAADSVEVRG